MSRVDSSTVSARSFDRPRKDEPASADTDCATPDIGATNVNSFERLRRPDANVVEAVCETPPLESPFKAGKEEWLILTCLGLVSLMVALDATIVVPALPVSGPHTSRSSC